MTKDEFIKMVCAGSDANRELESKVKKQDYVYIKCCLRIIKVNLMSIVVFPYGTFEVGNWNGKIYKNRTTLNWEDYGKTWALTKEELL